MGRSRLLLQDASEEGKTLSRGLLALVVILVIVIVALFSFSLYKICTSQKSYGWLRFDRQKRRMVLVDRCPGCESVDEPDNDEDPYGRGTPVSAHKPALKASEAPDPNSK